MVRNSILVFCIFFGFISYNYAQHHLIYLKDKTGTPYSISNPEAFLSSKSISRRIKYEIPIHFRDLPVNPSYLNQISGLGGKVIYSSKWLNAVLIQADMETLSKIKDLSFVREEKEISVLRKSKKSEQKGTKSYSVNEENYGASLIQNQMIGIDEMHKEGIYGEGITIAVLDAGFFKVNELTVFDSLIKNNRITSTYDFVNKESSVYEDNSHGMQVLSVMAGYSSGKLIGGAYKSNYILLKTEDTERETKLEEIYWTVAAEYADSAGADILSSSLGYTTFDNAADNYSPNDLDGETALITKAADFAAATGMLVLVSAGNEGNDPWKRLSFPADADSILSVGSVNKNGEIANFSSVGNTVDNRIKPEVVAMGVGTVVASANGGISTNNGTSFSAPLITALAAGLWQTFPQLNNQEIINLIKASGNKTFQPDSLYGYGIPNYVVAKQLQINGLENDLKNNAIIYPNPSSGSITIMDPAFNSKEHYEITVFNSAAQKVYSKKIKAINRELIVDDAEFNRMPMGSYLIRVSSKSTKVTRRLIKT